MDNQEVSNNRLGTCDVCSENAAKYTCPRCEVKSCNLMCVKKHKDDLKCSGERDKTAFKTLSKFTNLDLLSDYRMLEETARSVENYNRDHMKKFSRFNRKLPVHLSRLQAAVSSRGLKIWFLPQNFSRHRANTTYLDWKTRKIYWRIEWIFPEAEGVKGVDERALEDLRLSMLVNKYLDQRRCPSELKSSIQFHQAAGLSGVRLLLKAEHVKKSSSRFYELDSSLTLKTALRKKVIIEFPTIYVVLSDHKDMFEVIDSDEDNEELPVERGQSKFNHHRTRWEQHNSNRNVQSKKTKNLLFNESDLSDSDYGDNLQSGSNAVAKSDLSFNIPDYHELIHQNQ